MQLSRHLQVTVALLIPIFALHNPGAGDIQNAYLECTAKCTNEFETQDFGGSTNTAGEGILGMCFAGCACDDEDPMSIPLLDTDPNAGNYNDCEFLCDGFLNAQNTDVWGSNNTFSSKWKPMFSWTSPTGDTGSTGTWRFFPLYFSMPFYSSFGGAQFLMDETVNPISVGKDYCRSACNERGICTPSYNFETLSSTRLVVDESTGTWSCSAGSYAETDITTIFSYPFVSGSCTDVDCPADSYGIDVASGCTCIYDGEVIATTESPYYTSTCTDGQSTGGTSAAMYSTPSALLNGIVVFLCMMAHHY